MRIRACLVVAALTVSGFAMLTARPAAAGWIGGPSGEYGCTGTVNGTQYVCPTREEVCRAWVRFYAVHSDSAKCNGDYRPNFNGRGEISGYNFTIRRVLWGVPHDVAAGTSPICESGQNADALIENGCSGWRPSNPRQLGFPSCNAHPVAFCGNPINIATGNKVEEAVDYRAAGAHGLVFRRTYNSQGRDFSAFGVGWRSNFEQSLFFLSGLSAANASALLVRRPDGGRYRFNKSSGVWVRHDKDVEGSLTTDGSTTWTYVDADDTVETYDFASGRLTSRRTRAGYVQSFQYDGAGQLASVTDSFGKTLSFTYDGGVVRTMTDPDGRVYTYTYDEAMPGKPDRLIAVTYPGATAPTVQYLYEDATYPYALTGIVDENGNRYASWSYDAAMRAVSSEHAGGAERVTVAYNFNYSGSTLLGGNAIVTNALGKESRHTFALFSGALKVSRIDELATANTPATVQTITYDANGWVASRADKNGNRTTYQNDARGLVLSRTEAAGTPLARTTTYTWHPTLHVPTQIVEPGRTTTLAYFPSGLLQTKTVTDGATGRTRQWSYTYTAAGLLETVDGPRTDVADSVTYAYDSAGNLVSVTNALGQATLLSQHDASGRPRTITDPNGVATTHAYDERGRISGISTAGATTAILYDPAGNVVLIRQPDMSYLAYAYDPARRLTGVSNALDERIEYTLDALGGRTQTRLLTPGAANVAKTQSQVFDELGRVLRSIGAAGQTTSFAYDNHGNATGIVDPLTNPTTQAFDALHRLVTTVGPLSSTIGYGYDARDNRTRVTDPRGLVTNYVFDGLDNLLEVQSPDTGTTVHLVDDAGNRTRATDAAGRVAEYGYDALNRVTSITYPGSPGDNIVFRYDEPGASFGIGRLTSVTDASGTTAYGYDARGNVVSLARTQGGVSYAQGYAYTLADRVSDIVYPSGRIVTYARDAAGRISGITTRANAAATPATVVSGVAYLPFGPVAGLTWGNGLVLDIDFDADYQPSARLVAQGGATVQSLAYWFDAAGSITAIGDGVDAPRSQTFDYDALARLTDASGVYGTLTYGYDAVGNRTSQTRGAISETYTYAVNSNRLMSVASGGVTRSFGYDAAGNIASDSDAQGRALTFAYNAEGRLGSVANNNQPQASYTYNFRGQRAAKSVVGATPPVTHFHYDEEGHLLAETDGAGTTLREYVWLDDMPVGLVAGGTLYFLHPDHLGTPQKITDAARILVWDTEMEPFGATEFVSAAVTMPLRFPGQYADAESGFHQNWFRDYDPSIGRYIQSDPIGLAGGINTYAYVKNRPLMIIDPKGLNPAAVCAVFPGCSAAAIGGATKIIGTVAALGTTLLMSGDSSTTASEKNEIGICLTNTPEQDPCEDLLRVDNDTCNAITRRRGRAAGARCHATATQRYSECLRWSVDGVRTPLDTWNN